MNFASREHWWHEIQTTIPSEDLTPAELDQLRTMVTSKVFKKAVTMVYAECVGAGTALLSLDLKTQEGISEALRLQGKAHGMQRVLESLVELVSTENENEGEQP